MTIKLNDLASDVQRADLAFFSALVGNDVEALDRLLSDDFILVDVMQGSEVSKDALLGLLASGPLTFDSIVPSETRIRLFGSAAVVIGRTEMRGRMGGEAFSLSSRYTHVYSSSQGTEGWVLVSAQGTRISD